MTDYRAGRLLVSVIPDMRGSARKIREEFSGLGPYDVRINAVVDDKGVAGLRAALRSLPDVVITADSSPADRELRALRDRIMTLSDQQIGVDVSAVEAKREVDSIRADLARLANESPNIAVRVDAAAAESALAGVSAELGKVNGRTATVKVTADTGRANGALAITDAAAGRLDGRSVTMRVIADTGRAVAALVAVGVLANRFANRKYSFTVDADTAGAVAGIAKVLAMLTLLSGGAGVVSGLAGALGGLGAAGAVAGAGLGAVVLGSLGVGKAITAMNEQQASAGEEAKKSAKAQADSAAQVQSAQARLTQATTAASRARSDARRDEDRAGAAVDKARADGARSVAKAERDASESIASAKKQAASAYAAADAQVAQALTRLGRSTADLRRAQADLTKAWEDGRRSLEDLQDQVDGNSLDQRQAAFDLADARKALAEAQAGGDTDQIARAQLGLDKQLETIDQLNKRTARGQADNLVGQRAGVAGTDAYTAALERVRGAEEAHQDALRDDLEAVRARRAAREEGAASIAAAERDGAESVAEARRAALEDVQAAEQRLTDQQESGRRSIEAADQQVIESQRALTKALQDTGDSGSTAGEKVAQAFANLSPAAADFARFIFGLKPVLEGLSGTAAAGLFPPLTEGINALLTRLPLITTVVGQLASGMGQALRGVLVELASPFWAQFFTLLGNSAATILPGLFSALMAVFRAVAILLTALLPLAPAGFDIITMLADLIGYLAPFLAILMGGTVPAAKAFLAALYPLGPVLAALTPILNVLGILLAQVLGAVLQMLAPVLVALTPLIVAWAQSMAGALVGSLTTLTPLLVGIATWLSAHPGLVIGVVGAVLGLVGALKPLAFIAGLVVTALARMVIVGAVTSLLTTLGLQGTVVGRALMFILQPISKIMTALGGFLLRVTGASSLMGALAKGVAMLGRAVLVALGPFGLIAVALGIMYSQSEPFRNAINGLLGVLMALVGQIVGAVMPIFDTLGGVLTMIGGVFGMLVGQLAGALVPVINLVAGTLGMLIGAVLPPLVSIINSLLPVIMMLAGVFVSLLVGAVVPLIGVFTQLIMMILPPLVGLLQSVVVPVIQFLAKILSGVLVWVITTLVVPALTAIMWVITNVLVPAFTWLVSMIVPAIEKIGQIATWLWTNVISPVFGFIGDAARVLFAVIATVLIAPLLIAWNLIAAAATWLWQNVLQPVFAAIGAFISWVWTNILAPTFAALVFFWQNVIAPAATWLWMNVLQPTFAAIGAFISWVWTNILKPTFDALVWLWQNVVAPAVMWLWQNVIKPAFDGIGMVISWVWTNVIKPAFDAVVGGLNWLGDNFTRVTQWIGDIWNRIRGFLAKPINFMIDTVWNKGVVPAWNKVAELVGLGPIGTLGLIPEAATGGHVDTAGQIHGRGTGTSDSVLARVAETDGLLRVSNREFIMNEKATRANLPMLTAMNGGAEIGGPRRSLPGLAGGGPVSWQELQGTIMGAFPNARITDTVRPGAHDFHGAGKAIDIGGTPAGDKPSMLRVNQWIAQNFGGSAELIHTQPGAVNIKNGKGHQYSSALQEQHRDHVHWANNGGKAGGFKGWISGVGESISTFFRDSVAGAFDSLTNPPIDALRGAIGPPPPKWKEAVPALAVKMRDTVRDWVFGKADAKDAEASTSGGGGTMGPLGDGEAFIVRQIADSARAHGVGFDGGVIGVATGIVESGLRNLNYGDRDSVGVFQQRGNGAWGTLEQRMNPRHAADMFYNQLVRFNWRAMAPGDAAQKVQRSGVPGAYATRINEARGILAQHGGPFDSGGIARGQGLLRKATDRDERMLDPIETDDHDTLGQYVEMIEDGRLATPANLSPREVAQMVTAGAPAGSGGDRHYNFGGIRETVDVDMVMDRIDFLERSEDL